MNNNLSARRSHHWLTREQRSEVKNLLQTGSRAEELAVKFDVHFNTIRNIGKEQSVTTPPYQMGHIAPNGPISKNPGTEEKDSGASPCACPDSIGDAGAGQGGGSGNPANRDPKADEPSNRRMILPKRPPQSSNPPIEKSKNRRIEESPASSLSPKSKIQNPKLRGAQ